MYHKNLMMIKFLNFKKKSNKKKIIMNKKFKKLNINMFLFYIGKVNIKYIKINKRIKSLEIIRN